MRDKTKKSYYRMIFRSYALAVSIPVFILCALIFRVGVMRLMEAVETQKRDAVSTACALLDERMKECDNLALSMSREEVLFNLGVNTSIVDAMQAINRLNSYTSINLFFDDIILLQYGHPLLYTSKGTVSLGAFCGMEMFFSADDATAFERLANTNASAVHYFPSADVIVKFMPYPMLTKTTTGCMIYVLRKEALVSAVSLCMDATPYAVALLDEEGSVLYSASTLDLVNIDGLLDKAVQADAPRLDADGRQYVYIRDRMVNTGWQLLYITPIEAILTEMRLAFILLCVVGVLLLSGALVWGLSRKQFRPIQHLSGNGALPAGAVFQSREFSAIYTAMERTRALQEAVERQRREQRDSLFLQLLRSEAISRDEARSLLGALGLFARHETTSVILLTPCGKADADWREALIRRVEEALVTQDRAVALPYDADNKLTVIVSLDEAEQPMVTDSLLASLRALCEHPLRAGVSLVAGPDKLALSFMQARTALESVDEVSGGVCYFHANSMPVRLDWDYINQERLLIGSIRSLEEEQACATLRAIVEGIKRERLPRQVERYYQQRLALKVAAVMPDTAANTGGEEKLFLPLTIAFSYISMDEFAEYLCGVIRSQCDRLHGANALARQHGEILEWMRRHMTDPLLSLDMLADAKGYSTAYWSRFFREKLGMNFSDYVWQARCDEAKRMLREGDASVKQVVMDVGYVDVSSFIRRFKQQEGMTPGQYRNCGRDERSAED